MNRTAKRFACIWVVVVLVLLAGCQKSNKIVEAPMRNEEETHAADSTAERADTSEENRKENFDLNTIEGQAGYAMTTLPVWDGGVAASYNGGDGSETDPYQISNGAQLAKLKADSEEGHLGDTYFILTSDILLNDVSKWNFDDLQSNFDASWTSEWNTWDAIGQENDFYGIFDGNGHTIFGLYNIGNSESAQKNYGLFSVAEQGEISNVGIACSLICPSAVHVGGIVGNTSGETIKNCSVKQSIISSNLYSSNGTAFFVKGEPGRFWRFTSAVVGDIFEIYIGGICGTSGWTGTIDNCTVDGAVQYLSTAPTRNLVIGGIAGQSNCAIKNCKKEGTLTVAADINSTYNSRSQRAYIYAGGICGSHAANATITNCMNDGSVDVTSTNQQVNRILLAPMLRVGGIAGYLGGRIQNSANNGQVSYTGDMDASVLDAVGKIDTSELFDHILCVGDHFWLVAKETETVTDVTRYIGVINEKNEWIVPLSNEPMLARTLGSKGDFETACKEKRDDLRYIGDGVIFWDYMDTAPYFFFVASNKWINVGEFETYFNIFHDGYIIASQDEYRADHNHVRILSSSGEVTETNILCYGPGKLGPYSEGLFFAYDGFYNLNCEKVIDLSKYAGLIKNNPYFSDGECILTAENEKGTQYEATIDHEGNFIREFTQVAG